MNGTVGQPVQWGGTLGRRTWIIAVVCGALALGCDRAPMELSKLEWETLQDCRRQGGEAGAPAIWAEAEARYDSAWWVITTENEQWFFERDFSPAESLLVRSGQSALQAVRVARVVKDRERQQLDSAITQLRSRLAAHREGLDSHLARIPLQGALTDAELKIAAAARSFETEPEAKTQAAVDEADQALTHLEERLASGPWAQTTDGPRWKRMVDETISWSRVTDSAALVVVKMDRRAYLLRNGRIVADFPVELGYRSWRQKMRAGDGATPEGTYLVTRWRVNGSRYYKALVLNYPNDHDREQFEYYRRSGQIPRTARIGGNIEIHGEGGRGEDWTEGCVALRNDDMDRLMEHMKVGDRVTIVRDVPGWPQ
ncbi:MAG: L,D-transpeptidase [candidate division Zixibacteria bacterium]|nr:L,D-transpeptidase [candidate division Zixibacteria bacterium]